MKWTKYLLLVVVWAVASVSGITVAHISDSNLWGNLTSFVAAMVLTFLVLRWIKRDAARRWARDWEARMQRTNGGSYEPYE